MKATTLKIENPLLKELKDLQPPETSLSAFVREILEKAVKRHRMSEAAGEYVKFLEGDSEERDLLEKWESADLAEPPKNKRRRRS